MHTLIELRHISKSYPIGDSNQTILQNINLTISAKEQVAIMGASGSGKTTLINILGLLDVPTGGEYFLQGKNISTLDENERAKLRNQTIGFIFQSFYLLPRLTILENIALPLYYRGISEKERNESARQMLHKVDLGKYAAYKPNQLSGGQQQRVAIARALVGNPRFILADEPTGSLDSATGQMIMDLFKSFSDQVTLIIVTHDAAIAAKCQRTIYIQDGRVVVPEACVQ